MDKGKKTIKDSVVSTQEYIETLVLLKKQVQEAQIKAVLVANRELIALYWDIGRIIVERQEQSKWGARVIELLVKDLQAEFPGLEGFSRANIFYMRAFYLAYAIVQQPVGQFRELPIAMIPWGHNVILITKLKNNTERFWYAEKCIEYGWSRTVLGMQIESGLYARTGKAVTNFARTLPAPHSDMAQQVLKDPYVFDFLTLRDNYLERDLEQGLIDNVQKLLLELGKGFSFVARQYHLQVGSQNFYIDLLFYHYKLRCFVVVELKSGVFDPRDAGQLNFYLSAIDSVLKSAEDKPTIGLLLCKSKDNVVAEYALRDMNKPMGIAGYEDSLVAKLPKDLQSSLPTIEEIEVELEKNEALQIAEKEKKETN